MKSLKFNSIRGLIVLIFTVEILFFAILTGYFSYTSGLHTVMENANQTVSIVNGEITKMLVNYLEEPYKLEQIHKNVILNQQTDFLNQEQRDNHFVEMLKIFPKVTNSYIGFASGEEFGARRENDGSFVVWNTTVDKQTLDYYQYDTRLGRQGYLGSLSSYNIRQRPPFIIGVASKKPVWTDVYASATGRGLVITAVYPVYGQADELIGVLGSSLLLDWIDEFLQSLTVTKHSSIFVIDKKENLIATTDDALRRKRQEASSKLLLASDGQNRLLSLGITVLKQKVQSVEAIKEDVSVRFDCDGETFLLHAHPIYDPKNIGWISMILIPEKDLTYPIHDLVNRLLFITLLACMLGLTTGILSARYIINPIIKVNRVAKKIAEGDFSSKIDIDRQDEVGQLVRTFNEMSAKLEEARKAMLAAQEARIKAEKIVSIGTMAAGVSHEINQPLNSIKVISGGILYLLNQGEKLHAEEFTDSIQEISNQTDRITKIIKHLRSFIRRDESQLVPCSVNTAVEMALEVVGKQLADHAVTVNKNLQENLPPVLAHATGLEEIIVNLLVNAMQALDTVDKPNKEICIRTYFSTDVILEVGDNGPGIDPALGNTMFESFTSTKPSDDNLGLGMAIVSTIVTAYSGTIQASGNTSGGATFTVTLPPLKNDGKENSNENFAG